MRDRKSIKSGPKSSGFENDSYQSLNAFSFINASGVITNVRWAMVSVQPFEPAKPEPAPDKNYLFEAVSAAIWPRGKSSTLGRCS